MKSILLFVLCPASYIFDCIRYLTSADFIDFRRSATLESKVLKLAHSLDKGLTIPAGEKRSGFGHDKVVELLGYLKLLDEQGRGSFAQDVARRTLMEYRSDPCASPAALEQIERAGILDGDQPLSFRAVKTVTSAEVERWAEVDLDDFFLERYSIRFFDDRVVDPSLLEKAVLLASKTPSVCNRQGWVVFNVDGDEKIQRALDYQTGSSEFRGRVRNMVLVCCDFRQFHGVRERNQGWVDGGLFAMSLMYAFRRIGLGSVPLNCNLPILQEMQLKKALKIPGHYGLIMFIAYGGALPQNLVPVSPRKPVKDILLSL